MKLTTTAFVTACCLLACRIAPADGLQITEVYFGISGPDGVEDFVEVSNLGPGVVNLGGLFYDDSSLDPTAGGDLPAIDLAPGESAVFLVNIELDDEDLVGLTSSEIADLQEVANAEAVAEFEGLFGPTPNLFAFPNGGLSSGGDTAAIIDGAGNVIDSFEYLEEDANELLFVDDGNGGFTVFTATYENLTGTNNTPGNLVQSVEGVNGAFGSSTFLTDSPVFGGTEEVEVPIFIVASPGFVPGSAVVPEPMSVSLMLLAAAGVASGRRRG